METLIPDSWSQLRRELEQPYFHGLAEFLREERKNQTVLPPEDQVFAAFDATPLDEVKVLVVGQDPYHDIGQAHGLCFSVMPNVKLPPSLKNIYKELQEDLAIEPAQHGYLMSWANQGVLLLNTVLTVRAHEANSHRMQGWEKFTDAAIRLVAARTEQVVFVLWGKPAQKKRTLIESAKHAGEQHVVIESPHPSPLSAHRGFFGSKPFSRINAALEESSQSPIDWALPDKSLLFE